MSLSPYAFRTLYNVADALRPGPDTGAADLAPAVQDLLSDARRLRALRLTLAWLELETRLLRSPTRGFSWLSREERWERLAVWERSRLPWRRHAFVRLADLVDDALARTDASGPGGLCDPLTPGGLSDQSRPGA